MIQVQINLEAQTHNNFKMELNILRREDANEDEYRWALAIEKIIFEIAEKAGKEAGCNMKIRKIKGFDLPFQGA